MLDMLNTPVVAYRDAQPYVAIRTKVAADAIPNVLPPLVPEIFTWLEKHNVLQDGPPFFRYLSCSSQNQMLIEVGILVKDAMPGDGRVLGGHFPAGHYLQLTYLGHYSGLRDAHMFLESWGEENGLRVKQWPTVDGIMWGGRTEFYVNDCEEEPDPGKWQTDVVFLLEEEATS